MSVNSGHIVATIALAVILALTFAALTGGVAVAQECSVSQPPTSSTTPDPTVDPETPEPTEGEEPTPEPTPAPLTDPVTITIEGTICDFEAEAPVAGATIHVLEGDVTAVSDEGGHYSLEVPWDAARPDVEQLRRITIVVTAPGYGSFTALNYAVTREGGGFGAYLRAEPHVEDFTCLPRAIAGLKPECAVTPAAPSTGMGGAAGNGSTAMSWPLPAAIFAAAGGGALYALRTRSARRG